mgnify:CR=1 FL=1
MSKKIIYSAQAPEPIGPYSQAVQAGNMLFISGQIAIQKSSGNILTGNIETETQQVMENLKEILTAAGMDFSHVVKSSIFLKDMAISKTKANVIQNFGSEKSNIFYKSLCLYLNFLITISVSHRSLVLSCQTALA